MGQKEVAIGRLAAAGVGGHDVRVRVGAGAQRQELRAGAVGRDFPRQTGSFGDKRGPADPLLGLRQSPFVLDPTFGVAVKGVRLHRHVEMLQWVETSHTSTSSTPEDEDRRLDDDRERIYMYDLRWREEVIESMEFNDPSYGNPPAEAWKYRSLVVKAKDLVVGEFSLPDELVEQIRRRNKVMLDAASRRVMANLLDQRGGERWRHESALANVSVKEYFFYLMPEIREPVLGDQRVHFEVAPNYPVTVCAKQQGNELVPFKSTAGDSLHLLEDGIMSADELFDKKMQAEVTSKRTCA
ncbi:hypothetical protein ON010_g18178 [Phytophthora cinnamomi]|nr:hypothetical protein ON010_g18178 [Phytophthora cinnamomi]